MLDATGRVSRRIWLFAYALLTLAVVPQLSAQTPPTFTPPNTYTQSSAYGGGAAIAPQPWPAENVWVPYSWGTTWPDPPGSGSIEDPKVQDPSNGGTTPQNYVNVSSGACTDKILPSIYYYYNPATQM